MPTNKEKKYEQLITIIIPLHNRNYNINSLLQYYDEYDFKIEIQDSSKQETFIEPKFLKKENINYTYIKDELIYEKFFRTLSAITTPYCVNLPDDDFLLPSAIFKSIEFLEKNDNYISVFGRTLMFYEDGTLDDNYNRNQYVGLKNLDNNLKNHIQNKIDYFIPPNHNITRTKYALIPYDFILKYKTLYPVRFFDKIYFIILSSLGKIKMIDGLYMLRAGFDRTINKSSEETSYNPLLEKNIKFGKEFLDRITNYDKNPFLDFFKKAGLKTVITEDELVKMIEYFPYKKNPKKLESVKMTDDFILNFNAHTFKEIDKIMKIVKNRENPYIKMSKHEN